MAEGEGPTDRLIAIGFVADAKQPTTPTLAVPSADGEYATAGSTTVLAATTARQIAPLLQPTGETVERRFVWGSSDPVVVNAIYPLVVEVEADAAVDAGVLRHGARLLRAGPRAGPEARRGQVKRSRGVQGRRAARRVIVHRAGIMPHFRVPSDQHR
ncbi:MAG: hypothetical protein ABR571_13865 [Jatrophihabitans sp.]|uniref:hypothetical protein n=1 Tax=Jatrophihabitans sp. TaxID=1932789 RepID=UPI0039155976